MQRPTRTIRMVDMEIPPAADSASETATALPASFADWLAQPSHVITVGPETESELFVGLPGDSRTGDQANPHSSHRQ